MPSLEIDEHRQGLWRLSRHQGRQLRGRAGRIRRHGRALRLRQVHAAARHRRARDASPSGSVRINGRDITRDEPSDRGVAMVFQNYALYPHMSVRENMGFALKIAGRPRAEIDSAVQRAAEILRITEHLDKKPKQLSGGQKQRVAIGRAITRSPDVFLFDEPLSQPRRGAALADAGRARAAACRAQGDDGLCDARPDRSHDDGEPDRRPQ